MTRNPVSIFALVGLSALMSIATPSNADDLTIPGTGDGMSVLQAVADAFNASHPEHNVTVPPSIGSGGGVKAVGEGHASLGRVARGIKDKEAHYGLEYTPIFTVPVVFAVNSSVSVDSLSAQQIIDIYSGNHRNWAEVGAGDHRVRVVRREDGDSSLKVLLKTFPGFSGVTITDSAKETATTQETFEIISAKEGVIGFGPLSDAVAYGVNSVDVDGIDPLDPKYPSVGTVALIYKAENYSGVVSEFIQFALSEEGQQVVREALTASE